MYLREKVKESKRKRKYSREKVFEKEKERKREKAAIRFCTRDR